LRNCWAPWPHCLLRTTMQLHEAPHSFCETHHAWPCQKLDSEGLRWQLKKLLLQAVPSTWKVWRMTLSRVLK
jgi:hypothetical protein